MAATWRRTRAFPAVFATFVFSCAIEAQTSAQSTSATMPTFAGVIGDGIGVDFSWWAVKGATTYELLRTPDPQTKPFTVGTVPSTTLGLRDKQAAHGPVYYQLVAIRSDGSRSAGAWFHYYPPTLSMVSSDGLDVLVSWLGVPSAPGGYEVWRTPNLQQRPKRVGAVSSTVLSCRDIKAGPGPFYYQVIAIGQGGKRAASGWSAVNAPAGNAPALQTARPSVAPAAVTAGTAPGAASSSSAPGSGLRGVASSDAQGHEQEVAALLAQELANVGVTMDKTTEQAMVDAITKGGAGGIELALVITQAIAEVPARELTPQQVDSLLSSLPADPVTTSGPNSLPDVGDPKTDPAVLEFSSLLRKLLAPLKKR